MPKSDRPPPAPTAEEVPESITLRLTEEDRALFARVRALSNIKSHPDILRYALGAAERELTRAGGTT